MSITRINNEAAALRAENKRLMEANAKLRNTAAAALALVEKHKELLAAVMSRLQELRGTANVDTRGCSKS